MLTSGEFWSQGSFHAKVKTPLEMVVSAVRAADADVSVAYPLANELQKLGEPLYRKIEPTGYSNLNAEWVSSAALLERMNFALRLAQNHVSGAKVTAKAWENAETSDPMSVAEMILENEPSEQTRAAIQKMLANEQVQSDREKGSRKSSPGSLAALVAGLTLGSPEFQRR